MIRALRSKEKLVKVRSFLIGSGYVMLFLGAFSGYIIFPISPIFFIFSGLISMGGMIAIYSGVMYKVEESGQLKKK